MKKETQPRPMFPDSRIILGIFSPVLAVFFFGAAYFTNDWQPIAMGDKLAKFGIEDVLFTFISLCGVGLMASLVGPDRVRPLINRIGGKAALSGVVFMSGTMVYIIFSCWISP